jgi:hypothetical protein
MIHEGIAKVVATIINICRLWASFCAHIGHVIMVESLPLASTYLHMYMYMIMYM